MSDNLNPSEALVARCMEVLQPVAFMNYTFGVNASPLYAPATSTERRTP